MANSKVNIYFEVQMEKITDGQKANLHREKAFSCPIFHHHSNFLSSLSISLPPCYYGHVFMSSHCFIWGHDLMILIPFLFSFCVGKTWNNTAAQCSVVYVNHYPIISNLFLRLSNHLKTVCFLTLDCWACVSKISDVFLTIMPTICNIPMLHMTVKLSHWLV